MSRQPGGSVTQDRTEPRYEVRAYVDVVGKDVLLYHKIQNLSLGGICIHTANIEEIGTIVDVLVNFPDLGKELSLKGEVVWANHRPPKDVGIRWVDMTDDDRELLVQYFEEVKTVEIEGDPSQKSSD